MKITVELIANLAEHSPTGKGRFEYELDDDANVRALIDALGIPDERAGAIMVNGEPTELSARLQDGTNVTLIPPLAGG